MAYNIYLTICLILLLNSRGEPFVYWGFFGHKLVSRLAVYALPVEMYPFFRRNIRFLSEWSVKPDQRRYAVPWEGQRHFLDMDAYPDSVMTTWMADLMYADSIPAEFRREHGDLPRQVVIHMKLLTRAMMERDNDRIIKLAAELSHYVADAHVPLHTTENYDGQYSGQTGIHGLWESRLPELFHQEYDLYTSKAAYVEDTHTAIWAVLTESHSLVDSVLQTERKVSEAFGQKIMAHDQRGRNILRQYAPEFAGAYDRALAGMVERRLRQSAGLIASLWYTCWVDAGMPELEEGNSSRTQADSADIRPTSVYGGRRAMIHG